MALKCSDDMSKSLIRPRDSAAISKPLRRWRSEIWEESQPKNRKGKKEQNKQSRGRGGHALHYLRRVCALFGVDKSLTPHRRRVYDGKVKCAEILLFWLVVVQRFRQDGTFPETWELMTAGEKEGISHVGHLGLMRERPFIKGSGPFRESQLFFFLPIGKETGRGLIGKGNFWVIYKCI